MTWAMSTMATTKKLHKGWRSGVIIASFAIFATLLTCLSAFASSENVYAQSTASPVTIKTDNNSVDVIVSWTPQEIQAGENADFSLEFQNPSTGQTLSHVNYNFKIIDPSDGTVIKSIDGIHVHSGKDVQTVMLDNKGEFELEVTVLGLGINKPWDTSSSGTAQTAIMVVPEFPFVLMAMAAGMAIVILMARSRFVSVSRFLTGK